MSDTKLDPRSLTSEERAIVDYLALQEWISGRSGSERAYMIGLKDSTDMILARRAVFGEPASDPAKVECPNCGEMTSENHEVVQSDGLEGGRRLFFYTCQQQISELDDRHIRMASPEAQEKFRAAMQRRISSEPDVVIGAVGGAAKPAQPEPVAAEMPEAVRNVISALVQASADSDEPDDQFEYQRVAENLESFWRTQAAEAGKVRMPKVRR